MRNIGAVYKRSLILKVLTLLIFLSIGYLIINFTYNKSSVVTKLSEKEITFIENLLYDGDRKTGQEEIKEVEEKVQDTTRILTSTPRNLQKAAKDNETGIVKQSKTHDKPYTVISKENEEPTKNSTVVRSTEKSKFTTVVPPKALTQMTELRDCFFIKNNNLPDVFDQTLQKENSIFFFDTACASFAAGKITVKARQACSIESAALSNPNFNVYLLFASPGQLKNGETQSDRLLKRLNQYKNIKMLHVDFEKLLKTIPPQYLRHNNIYESEDTLAATIEFFILRKYGGIFLNNDVLVVKSFKDFPSNFIGLDSDNVLASHVFAWRHFSNDTKNDIGNMTYSKMTSFPKDISIRKKWLNACGLKENDILKNTRICGNHFSETCFHIVNTVTKCRSLIKGSVPSLLLLNKKSAQRKLQFSDGGTSLECSKIILEQEHCSPIIDVIAQESLSSELSLKQPIPKKQKRWPPAYLNRVDMTNDFATPRRARKHFEMAMCKINTLQKKVCNLNRRILRLIQKVRKLEDLLRHLKNKKLILDEAEAGILYCLSDDPNKPCHVLTFREITLMLDCGLSMQSVLNFLPLSYVYSNRLHNLPMWMPTDGVDPDLEGELRENGDRIFIDSLPEFCPPLDKLIDFSQIDVILISNYLCMMALPFITEGTGFQGKVYATEPTLQIGRLLLEELVTHIEQCPKANFATQWKNFVHKLPYPLNDSFKPKSWKQIYNMSNVNASLSRIQMVGYNEKIDVYGALQVLPTSSGYNLGSSNWIITSDHEKIVYLSGSSTLTTHPRPMDHHALKNADVLIMTDLTQTPISNPDSMLGLLCVVVSLTLRGGGNALIPCYPSGVIYDLFECLSIKMQDLGVQNCPMFFISPVADMSLAYSNILAEWLSSAKQNRVYVPDEPFPHASLLKNSKLKHFKHIYSEGFSTDFQEPCVVFCGHPSLRFGDVVQFIELWGNNPRNCIVFTEPDFDYIEALAPYQPIQMKVAHCAIDTSLNFTQANKLIKDLKPSTLVVPECYIQPPISAPTLTDLVIETSSDRTLIPYKWGEVINLPLKRKQGQILMETDVAQKVNPIEIKSGISLSSLTGELLVKDNVHNMTVRSGIETTAQKGVPYEWGLVNITEFLQKLAQEGIIDAKVEPSGNGVMIHLQDEDALIQIEDTCTHVLCNSYELRLRLRNILMQCLKQF
ncbi:hypothetical protein FQA39_LY04371 [Lamprigera yunnana]|nr:hypothetical protein FQA39_LY04371 [Lamprigera yunnana]